ncbi:hypothetical protein [Novosphingobium sp. Gsoil 351]|uniref:hypothetical protein n=1 Tax=Novosphingobium sp. Gsoil 351 TaxID=2675225 RepID=UPI0012B481D0|nr:hypothetical protein [Novosphingobium sp. Gsoil 351]QGN54477.1 hypothetical protein GKE62_07810 [Novosphingobium sp. Gsoil 351]
MKAAPGSDGDDGAASAGGSRRQEADPALDRLTAAFMRLLSEHWIQSEKLAHLTRLLARGNVIDPAELEAIGRETETDPAYDQAAADFVRRILAPLREPVGKAD